ncbi:MAG: ADP-ribosylation factor-like protein, partial [Candidatus Lokiarchaeia archaeon]|nr:ADP-ribosylation factor-like protein [Candidatus Lokiarchaeia archaeon]
MTNSKEKQNKQKTIKKEEGKRKINIIKAVVLSIFDENGPSPKIIWPEDLDEQAGLLIAMKTISLLMGDATYQDGIGTEGVNYFGVLPFPDLKLNGLTYFFLIPDDKARGKALAATITVLIDENNKVFFYENMKYLRVIIDKAATQIQYNNDQDEREIIIDELREELFEFTKELKDPFSIKRQLKILLTGLDKAGKTSFMLGVKRKYSEIIKSMPTKGVERTEENIFDEQNSQISIWDLGGQKTYREKYLEQSEVYLYNIDLMFFF